MATAHICNNLLLNGLLLSYAIAQRFLREQEADVQLVAQPFDAESFDIAVACIDVRTKQPQNYFLSVLVGPDEAAWQMHQLALSHERNTDALVPVEYL